ncbi:MAG TPA: YraN family protein [Terriglobia bacterium]|nr:YraN family protein [Terriglobia bacterium]
MATVFSSTRLRWIESALDALDRAAARRRPARAAHLITGARGERAALFWVRRRGYIVVARAWRSARAPGDLDLIAWLPVAHQPKLPRPQANAPEDTLCFIEVKTRTTRAVAAAEAAVDTDKRRTLRRLARHYLRQLPNRDVPTRFDILSVYFEAGKPADFEHLPSAFDWSES